MYYIGIDLGGTNIVAGITDEDGIIVHSDSVNTGKERSFKEIAQDMVELCVRIIEESGISEDSIKSVGIGTPGACDSENGVLIYASTFKHFENGDFRSVIQKHINVPVYIDNDGNCAALAEYTAGTSKGASSMVMLTLGTGIGAGIIINGKIYRGINGVAGEIGHTVIVSGGQQCPCGRKGCFEQYASATALIRFTREYAQSYPDSLVAEMCGINMTEISARIPFQAAKDGDKGGLAIIDMYMDYLAEGIINVINTFQPEILLLGGGISKEGEYLLGPIREKMRSRIYTRGIDVYQTRIVEASMGNDAGIIGAALLGRQYE